jgi:glucose-6-phosphate isomerase
MTPRASTAPIVVGIGGSQAAIEAALRAAANAVRDAGKPISVQTQILWGEIDPTGPHRQTRKLHNRCSVLVVRG